MIHEIFLHLVCKEWFHHLIEVLRIFEINEQVDFMTALLWEILVLLFEIECVPSQQERQVIQMWMVDWWTDDTHFEYFILNLLDFLKWVNDGVLCWCDIGNVELLTNS